MFIPSVHSYLVNLVQDNSKKHLYPYYYKKKISEWIIGNMKMLIYLLLFFFFFLPQVHRFIFYHARSCDKDVSWENEPLGTVLQTSFIIAHCEVLQKVNIVYDTYACLRRARWALLCHQSASVVRMTGQVKRMEEPSKRSNHLTLLSHTKWQKRVPDRRSKREATKIMELSSHIKLF